VGSWPQGKKRLAEAVARAGEKPSAVCPQGKKRLAEAVARAFTGVEKHCVAAWGGFGFIDGKFGLFASLTLRAAFGRSTRCAFFPVCVCSGIFPVLHCFGTDVPNFFSCP